MSELHYGIQNFDGTHAWFVYRDGVILDQGHNTDEAIAKEHMKASVFLWSTHDYERD